MWYHSALTLMLVEITARNEAQLFGLVFIYIINAIFNAILFGIYFDLLEEARHRLVERVVWKERIFGVCVDVWGRDEESTVRHKDVLDSLGRI